jgi:hypothetical protein
VALHYLTCCIDSTCEAIRDLVDSSRLISYRTARRKIGKAALEATFPAYDWDGKRSRPGYLPLKADWHVSYHKGRYLGRQVYYVRHSAIEYIFSKGEG